MRSTQKYSTYYLQSQIILNLSAWYHCASLRINDVNVGLFQSTLMHWYSHKLTWNWYFHSWDPQHCCKLLLTTQTLTTDNKAIVKIGSSLQNHAILQQIISYYRLKPGFLLCLFISFVAKKEIISMAQCTFFHIKRRKTSVSFHLGFALYKR